MLQAKIPSTFGTALRYQRRFRSSFTRGKMSYEVSRNSSFLFAPQYKYKFVCFRRIKRNALKIRYELKPVIFIILATF